MSSFMPTLDDHLRTLVPTTTLAALGTAVALASPAAAAADDFNVGYSYRSGVATNYVWRGSPMYGDLLTPAWLSNFQVNLNNLGPGGGYVGLWTGISLLDGNTWFAPFAGYTFVHEALWVDVSYGVYLSTDYQPVDQQHNLQASVSYGIAGVLRPRIMVAADPITVQGVYAQVGCQLALTEGPWNILFDAYSGVSEYRDLPFTLQDVSLEGSVTYPLSDHARIGIDGTIAYAHRTELINPAAGVFVIVAQ